MPHLPLTAGTGRVPVPRTGWAWMPWKGIVPIAPAGAQEQALRTTAVHVAIRPIGEQHLAIARIGAVGAPLPATLPIEALGPQAQVAAI